MDSARIRLYSALAIFFAAACLRLIYAAEVRGTALDRWHEWDQSDMATYLEQSRRIAEGDWLAREPYQAYHLWQRFAPESDWRRWSDPSSFHQAPGYSYFLAALRMAGGRFIPLAKLLQALMGAASAVLVFFLASRLAGPIAGCFAGGIIAVYGPLICSEHELLREAPSILLSLSAAAALGAHFRRAESGTDRSRGAALRLLAAGALFGALNVFHEVGRLALAAALGAVAWYHFPGGARRVAAAVGLLIAGWLVGFSPLLARNLAVGAPPLAVSTRENLTLAISNQAEAPGGGALWGKADPSVARILEEGNGSTIKTALAVARSYHGDVALFAKNLILKIRAAWAVREAPDNTSYAFIQTRAPLVRWLPGFGLLFAPGVAGSLIALRRVAAGWRRSEGRAAIADALFALLFLAIVGSALCAVHALGRLRLYVVPSFAIFAGLFLAETVSFARSLARGGASIRWKGALSACAALAVAAAFQAWAQAPYRGAPLRPGDFVVAANLEHKAGDFDLAEGDYASALALDPANADVRFMLGVTLLRSRGAEAAIAELRRAKESAEAQGNGDLEARCEAIIGKLMAEKAP